jgi:hypothetical protein
MLLIFWPTKRRLITAGAGEIPIGLRGDGNRSAEVIVLPTIGRIPRHIVSTSGSSGMGEMGDAEVFARNASWFFV